MKCVGAYAPRNSIALISGGRKVEIPASLEQRLVAATSTCIAVGTLSELDGETSFTLTDEKPATTDQQLQVVFNGILETPDCTIIISDILGEKILAAKTKSQLTEIEIRADDDREPAKLLVIFNQK